MSFLPLVRIWIWVSVLASAAGWLLSALGQLNRTGYAVFAGVVVAGLWLGRKALGGAAATDSSTGENSGRGSGAGCRPALPAWRFWFSWGPRFYPPTTHEGLTCRVPRVLHWLAEGHWHWIHTPNARMNDRPCGFEWLAAPLLLFTRSDRGLFLINFIPLLLLPGLIFSVFTRLGVRPRVAWHWMWLLPTGYNFLLQSGSLGNDTTPAFYALAAVDFGLRAWASRRPADLWLSILSAAFLTATKVSDLPLLLPWAVVVFPLLPLLLRRPAATLALVVLAASVSFLPTAALNIHYCGDWSGLAVEHSVHGDEEPDGGDLGQRACCCSRTLCRRSSRWPVGGINPLSRSCRTAWWRPWWQISSRISYGRGNADRGRGRPRLRSQYAPDGLGGGGLAGSAPLHPRSGPGTGAFPAGCAGWCWWRRGFRCWPIS